MRVCEAGRGGLDYDRDNVGRRASSTRLAQTACMGELAVGDANEVE